jgi:uncharacterized membrane protein
MIEPILIVGIAVICTALYMRHLWRRRAQRLARKHAPELLVLGERYARGEIDRDEYLQKRGDILGYPLAP